VEGEAVALRVTEDEFQVFLRRQGKPVAVIVPETPVRRSKYGNTKVTVDGETFDSKGEYRRHCELVLEQKAGLITGLQRQVNISLEVNGYHICFYRADWVYYRNDERVVEDFKGKKTDVYLLKSKLFYALFGQKIKEVYNTRR
jgi:Protein of unknown function (DUF1064)